MPGDMYALRVLFEAMKNAGPTSCPSTMIMYLNDGIKKCYAESCVSFDELAPGERLQVSAIIYSRHMRGVELWRL